MMFDKSAMNFSEVAKFDYEKTVLPSVFLVSQQTLLINAVVDAIH